MVPSSAVPLLQGTRSYQYVFIFWEHVQGIEPRLCWVLCKSRKKKKKTIPALKVLRSAGANNHGDGGTAYKKNIKYIYIRQRGFFGSVIWFG